MHSRWRKRSNWQQTRPTGRTALLPCGCGAVLVGINDPDPPGCQPCKVKAKVLARANGVSGVCVYCGDAAPGVCRPCDQEVQHGRLPKVTSPPAWRRLCAA